MATTANPTRDDFAAMLEQTLGGTDSFEGHVVKGTVTGIENDRSEEHTSELQSLMRISYAVFCLKKNNTNQTKEKRRYTKSNEEMIGDATRKTELERQQQRNKRRVDEEN